MFEFPELLLVVFYGSYIGIKSSYQNVIEHYANTVNGNSGSPVFNMLTQRVAAVHSGHLGTVSQGVRVSDLIVTLIYSINGGLGL